MELEQIVQDFAAGMEAADGDAYRHRASGTAGRLYHPEIVHSGKWRLKR
jgi:hypothetical protein